AGGCTRKVLDGAEGMAAVTVGPGLASPAPGLGMGPGPTEGADALFVALSAGITTLSHPLLYVKLLVQVRLDSSPLMLVPDGEDIEELTIEDLAELRSEQQKALAEEDSTEEAEDREEVSSDVIQSIMKKWNECQDFFEKHHPNVTVTNSRKKQVTIDRFSTKIDPAAKRQRRDDPLDTTIIYSLARHIVDVDGKRGLFRGLTPRIISSTLSTISRGRIKKAFPLEDMEHVSNKDDVKTSLRKVAKETSHEMMMQCASRVISHPLHVISVRCMVQFVGREVKYRGVFSSIGTIWKEEGLLGFFVGLVPHILGDIIFLWCCNLLAHFINTYAVDDNFNQASVIRSYTKFVMGIAVSMLTYPFLLVGDLMAVNNCGLLAGLHPYAPVFSSWIHCWKHLSAQVSNSLDSELCALECSKGPLLFAYSMSSAPISGTVTHSSSKNRDVCLLMGSSELPNGEENWGSSSEVPACFFAEHPHQQPFLLTNHTWKEETNLIYHRRNPKSLL
ncbi:hypothetical protein EYD10_01489, partial [Varanus komodoensis]